MQKFVSRQPQFERLDTITVHQVWVSVVVGVVWWSLWCGCCGNKNNNKDKNNINILNIDNKDNNKITKPIFWRTKQKLQKVLNIIIEKQQHR